MTAQTAPAALARFPGPEDGGTEGEKPAAFGFLFLLLAAYLLLEYARPPLLAALRLQMVIVLVLPAICLFSVKEKTWSPILTAQILFLVFCAATVPWRYNYYSAYMVTRVVFAHVAIAICLVWIASNPTAFRRLMFVWMGIMAYVAFFAVTHGGTGPGGFLGDENDLALACVAALPIAFFMSQGARGPERTFWLVSTVLFLMAIVASRSRGGFMGLASVAIYLFLVSGQKVRNLAILLVVSFTFFALAPDDYVAEIKSIGAEAKGENKGGTGEARRFLWLTAWNMWKEHPVTGVGGENYQFLAGDYQPMGPEWDEPQYRLRNWSGQVTHSAYFQLLSEQGLLGVGLWLAVVVGHMRLLRGVRQRVRRDDRLPDGFRRQTDAYASGLSAGMIGALASGAFLSVAYYPYVFYLSALGVALAACVPKAEGERGPD